MAGYRTAVGLFSATTTNFPLLPWMIGRKSGGRAIYSCVTAPLFSFMFIYIASNSVWDFWDNQDHPASLMGRLWWQSMVFFFIESDILELPARGSGEHFFCKILRIFLNFPYELINMLHFTWTINDFNFTKEGILFSSTSCSQNLAQYLLSKHLVNEWSRILSGIIVCSLWSLSTKSHLRLLDQSSLITWVGFFFLRSFVLDYFFFFFTSGPILHKQAEKKSTGNSMFCNLTLK